MEMEKKKRATAPPPLIFRDRLDGPTRYLVVEIPDHMSLKEVLPELRRRHKLMQGKWKGADVFEGDVEDLHTDRKRTERHRLKTSEGSKVPKPRRTADAKRFRLWVLKNAREMRRKFPAANDNEIAEKVHALHERQVLDSDVELRKVSHLYALTTIRKIISAR